MSKKILFQSLLKFRDQIKDGTAKVQDIITDYFNQTGKSVTDEERAIILNEFAKDAPDNVTTLEGVDAVETIMPMGGAKSKTPFTDQVRKENPGVEITGKESFGELMEKLGPKEEGIMTIKERFKDRLEFPELRKEALDQYKYWNPETVIIESKASGLPLTYELRKMGIPVINYTPSKGQDKHARVNAVSPLFESGVIWAPDEKFAEEVIEECASFPYGDHDDLVDSTTQAVMRFRQGGFVSHPEDEKDNALPRTERTYY